MRDVVFEYPDGKRIKAPKVLAGRWFSKGESIELEGSERIVISAPQDPQQLARDGFELVKVSRLSLADIKRVAKSKDFGPENADEMIASLLAVIDRLEGEINGLREDLGDGDW
jgi:hypothetical protein